MARKMKTPAAGNHWLRLIKTLTRFAVREQLRADDPARDIDYIKRKATGFHTWSEDEIAQFEVHHPIGSKARLALALLLYTAQRRSDVVKMGRQHIRAGVVHVRQQKTGTMLAIPVHPALQAVLDATPSEHLTFLTTAYGKPFTAAGFGNWFRDQCDAAGLPGALRRPWLAQGRLPQARRGRVLGQRHRLDQRAYDAARGRTLHQGRGPGAHGAAGHGRDHFTNGKWQRPLAEVATALKYKSGFAGGGRSGGTRTPNPRFWRPVL